MNNTQYIFEQSELALAAYANLSNGSLTTSTQQDALKDQGRAMAAPQAALFATRYSVVTQYTDSSTSFTATVFQDNNGQLTLAIRGTLEPQDYETDGDIWLAGAGYDQIVSMYNWWQRATNAEPVFTSVLSQIFPPGRH